MTGYAWTQQQQDVFFDRYALKSQGGATLEDSPEQMWHRVATAIAKRPEQAERFEKALQGFAFVPSGRVLSGAGGGAREATFYNCFVIGVGNGSTHGRDSRHGIMKTMTRMVEITARGGGVGINWSIVRPEGSYISGVQGWSSGANCWMSAADGLADQIRQGGSRTAALMFLLEDWHPDVVKFIQGGRRFSRANFSVGISDAFMRAVVEGKPWRLRFPDTRHALYDREWNGDIGKWESTFGPSAIVDHGEVDARSLWISIARSAWSTGNPGVVFLDRARQMSNTRAFDRVACVNPCGEQPLPENGSCNLGSINLMAHWLPKRQCLDFVSLGRTVEVAVEFLDCVIDRSAVIDEEISQHQDRVRRIGLGTMGLADLLIARGLRYGSPEADRFLRDVYSFIRDEAYLASCKLSKQLGPAPAYSQWVLDTPFMQSLPWKVQAQVRKDGLRNLALLTQAPTGTTSVLAGVSSGIEPIFSASYMRRDATGEHLVVHPAFQGELGPQHVTAHDLSVAEHIHVQATVQHYLDSAVSKTINLPSTATVEDVEAAFTRAYSLKCKGITVFRDGSLDGVLQAVEAPAKCDLATGECKTCSL